MSIKKTLNSSCEGYPFLISLPVNHSNGNGILSVAQQPEIPFSIHRAYWIYDMPEGTGRGGHAHKTLFQVLICLYGAVSIDLDDGLGWKDSVMLDNPSCGLLLPPSFWHTMRFLRQGSVLLSLASDVYDESDYIREFDMFYQSRNRKETI